METWVPPRIVTVAGSRAMSSGGRRAWATRVTAPALPVFAATSKK